MAIPTFSGQSIAKSFGYANFEAFLPSIIEAEKECRKWGEDVSENFIYERRSSDKAFTITGITDIKLSPVALFLIAHNDGSKNESLKRSFFRAQVKDYNKMLNSLAHKAGNSKSIDYSTFQNRGYLGLYEVTENTLHDTRKLKKSYKILDYMGSAELSCNLLRITMVVHCLGNKIVAPTKERAAALHEAAGKAIRTALNTLGRVLPEELPVARLKI